ncbi:MAG: flagellin [Pelagimonas sp.]|jgi:flagellin|nr:flagellin [Pelagimonas sp.]
MSSILTNNGAQTALQTLKSINANLSETQSQISTGKAVSSSKDNAAVWAISKVMEADVAGFKSLSDSLSLGQATVSVARQASETVADLLTEIKGKVVSAQGENVDRAKIQTDIEALSEQISAVVGAANFNGANLLSNKSTTEGSGSIDVLASMDRGENGVSSTDITVRKQDLGQEAATIASSGGTFSAGAAAATLNATQTGSIDVSSVTIEAGAVFSLSVYGTDADDSNFTQADFRTTAGANQTQGEMAASDLSYIAREGDTAADVASALASKWDSYASENNLESSDLAIAASGSNLNVSSSVTSAGDAIVVNLNRLDADAGSQAGGGLEDLANLDVSTQSGAESALAEIDGLLEIAVNASASFGSVEGRLETQKDFVSTMTSALQSGIGSLVDADMEETSARLQALQVQQQLATQALSIANRAPSSLLSLFR